MIPSQGALLGGLEGPGSGKDTYHAPSEALNVPPLCSVLMARCHIHRGMGPAAVLDRGQRALQDVFSAGTGTAESRVVIWDKRALTGQAVGRCRRIRSLYCLTCVATLKSVRISVEGWAVARAVWASVDR